jgi:ABC-type polysaccharide/polyol phosphate transport system ATPase subunit
LTAIATHTAKGRADVLATAPAAVSVERVSKGFRLPHQRYSTLKERVLHPFAARSFDVLQALENVSLEVRQGEFFGIVGRNGSGKSTLLMCLAGIYAIDSGQIEVRGRLSPFIELGVGFNPDLTARDNVLINAIMLGATRKQARDRFDDIIAFAELEEFVDLKLKNYSSGMSVRLGFSVAIQVDADILLVDEVLAVGDASFQRKCFDEFERMKAEGRTILFVTHDMGAVERFCDRAMLIDRGRVLDIGSPGEISRQYSEINFGQAGAAPGSLDGRPGRARILAAWCEDEQGQRVVSLPQGRRCKACLEVEFETDVEDPEFSLTFRNDVRHTIFVATGARHPASGRFLAGERTVVRFSFENWLAQSRYTLTPSVDTRGGDQVLDRREDLASLIVEAGRSTGGVADIPTQMEMERS